MKNMTTQDGETQVHFEGNSPLPAMKTTRSAAAGNGPIDAFFNAICVRWASTDYKFVSYQRARGLFRRGLQGAVLHPDSYGPRTKTVFGVGLDGNISLASIKGIICAINRASRT